MSNHEKPEFKPVEIPDRPPLQDDTSRHEDMPSTPPLEGEAPKVSQTAQEQAEKDTKFMRGLRNGLIAGGLILGAVIVARGCADSKDSGPKDGPKPTIVVEGPKGAASESCPEGVFSKEKPYAAAVDVKPGHLMRNPEFALNNSDEAYVYLMGNKKAKVEGELCALPSSVATFETIFNGWVGEGSAQARPFGSFTQDTNELNAFYAAHPDKAEKTLDNRVFKSFVDSFELNETAIKGGAYFKLSLRDNKIVQEPVQLGNLKANSVYELAGDVWYSDSKFTGKQVALMDKEGNVFVLQSIGGVPIIAPTPETTTSTTSTTSANTDSWSATPGNTSGNGNANTSGNTNGGSNGGGTGGNGGGSNGGGTGGNGGGSNGGGTGGNGGGSNGGGTGGSGGGTGGNGGGSNGGGTTTTTARPPVTTVPPNTTTTTQPKGTEITIPDFPN